MRVKILLMHWLTFHMQRGLCINLPSLAEEDLQESCKMACFDSAGQLYHHFHRIHFKYLKKVLKKSVKRELTKPLINRNIIEPTQRKWFDKILEHSEVWNVDDFTGHLWKHHPEEVGAS